MCVLNVSRKYPKVILKVCTCKFVACSQIRAIIKSDRPSKFSNLHIKHVRSLDPTVKLLDGKGNVKETLSIILIGIQTQYRKFSKHI